MKDIKINKKYIVIMFLVLIVGVGTITFAYFQGSVLNDLINPTNVSTGSIDIKISDTSVNATDVEPLFTNGSDFEKASFVKHFSVTNGTDTLNTCVELYLKVNSIDSALANSYFKYAIVNDDTGTTITGDFNGVSGGTELDLGSLYFFESSTVKNYTMYIWIEYSSDIDQAFMLKKSMSATLFVKAQDSKTKDACDTRSTFKLTYELNGGTGCNNTNVNKGDDVTLCTPTNTDTTLSFGGWFLDANLTMPVKTLTNISDDVKLFPMWSCTYDGELTQGAEYVTEEYIYRYMQEYDVSFAQTNTSSNYIPATFMNSNNIEEMKYVSATWINISTDGWGVALANRKFHSGELGKMCTYINNKPVVSLRSLISYNDSDINIVFDNLDTRKILSMRGMFKTAGGDVLDLSNFILNDNVDLTDMFSNSSFNTAYARDEATAARFNDSSITGIPNTFKFTVK